MLSRLVSDTRKEKRDFLFFLYDEDVCCGNFAWFNKKNSSFKKALKHLTRKEIFKTFILVWVDASKVRVVKFIAWEE